jgi:hypothetical protein
LLEQLRQERAEGLAPEIVFQKADVCFVRLAQVDPCQDIVAVGDLGVQGRRLGEDLSAG